MCAALVSRKLSCHGLFATRILRAVHTTSGYACVRADTVMDYTERTHRNVPASSVNVPLA